MLLKNQLALVTGSARGTGAAIAMGLAREGARVIVTDIDHSAAAQVCLRIEAIGGWAQALALDVTNAGQCHETARYATRWGNLSILVNNAGVRPRHPFASDERDHHWQHAMDVNVNGVRNVTLAFIPALRNTRGSVINITSITASHASPMSVAYSTSKAAAQMLTKALALELADSGIRVNAVAPGIIETDMTAVSRQHPERRQQMLSRIPMDRFGQPEELIGPVVFLASSMASYVTGAVIAVDGGYLAV